ncbi:hypothetical protein [Pengzhenrongella sicca]|uniref:DUF1648 domain-containing protein n=1 Tax=Pengzhenrongella sicca TaxID=2819238 RepID=A0A8A4ZEA1_9MICO|nr:hypothetical protein [Pengzhenrongella sicca]QTE30310.1 hypothetical protein J4E96_04720 [Pengzhenrongella sicca]
MSTPARPPNTRPHAPTRTRTRGRALTLTLILTAGLPLVLLLAAGALIWSWSGQLPSPVAAHWGPDGVDRTSESLTGLFVGGLGAPAALSLLLSGAAVLGGPPAGTRRMAAATSVWLAAFVGGLLAVLVWSQRGLVDAHDGQVPIGGLALVAAGSIALALAAAVLTPADPAQPPAPPIPADARRAVVRADERVVWTGSVRSVATDELAVAWAVLTILATLVSAQPAVLALLGIPVLLVLLGRWRVTVDRTGLWARGMLGVPRTGIALDEVVRADVTTVRPLRDFGGFGVRSDLHGRYGLVLRKGEAIAVQRPGGGVFVVTVDGAGEGVALLNALAERGRVTT